MTTRREAFYWLAILFTFALGTAAATCSPSAWASAILVSALIFAGAIGLVALAHFRFGLNAVLGVLDRLHPDPPLGASIGDWLSQDKVDGGLGLGTTGTSALFLAAILGLVVYLSVTKRDELPPVTAEA